MERLGAKSTRLKIAVIFLSFMYFGLSENIKGPAIPVIQADFGISEWQLGMLLAINALGFLIACAFTGLIIRKIEARAVLFLSIAAMVLSGVFIYLSVSYSAFSAAYFLMYIGNGLMEIVLSVLAARIFVKNTVIMMSLSHFFYGVGATVGPAASTAVMNIAGDPQDGWRFMYMVLLAAGIIPLVLCLLTRFPKNEEPEHTRLSLRRCFKIPVLWLLAAIMTLGIITELSIAGWLVNLLEKAFGFSAYSASFTLSAFFLIFTAGRLALAPLITKIGYTRSIIIFAGSAGIFTILGVILGVRFTFLLAAAGIGVAPLYPIVMAYVPKLYPNNTDGAVNFLVIIWAVGSVVGNFLVGAATDGFIRTFSASYGPDLGIVMGLKAGYITIGFAALISAFFGVILYRYLKKRDLLM